VARLRISHADGRAEERELAPGTYRVGREGADLLLPHGSVSAHHAQLDVLAGGVSVRDAGSRNGTLAPDGQRITAPYLLLPDQPIRLGACTLTLLRSHGHSFRDAGCAASGGTLVMQEQPALPVREARVQPPALPPVWLQRDTRALPAVAWWVKLLGVSVLLVLSLVSFQTCSALVDALGAR
jgi:hypothetical protein